MLNKKLFQEDIELRIWTNIRRGLKPKVNIHIQDRVWNYGAFIESSPRRIRTQIIRQIKRENDD